MSLSDLRDQLQRLEDSFKGPSYAAQDMALCITNLKSRIDQESSGLMKHGPVDARELSDLYVAATSSGIPNQSWNVLKAIVERAVDAESMTKKRFAEENGLAPIPPEVATRADLAFQVGARAFDDVADTALQEERSRAARARSLSAMTTRILEIERERMDALLQVRFDALVESLRFLDHAVAPFRGALEQDLDHLREARKRSVMDKLEQRSRTSNGGWDGAAMAAIDGFERGVESTLFNLKQKLALLVLDEERSPHTASTATEKALPPLGRPAPLPEEVTRRAQLLFQEAIGSIQKTHTTNMRKAMAAIARSNNSAGRLPAISAVWSQRIEAVIDAHLTSLADAVRFFRLRVSTYREAILSRLSKTAKAVTDTASFEMQRTVMASGSDTGFAGAVAAVRRKGEEAIASARRRLELLEQEESRGPSQDEGRTAKTTKSWRDYSPEQMAELVPVASKNTYLADIQTVILESGAGEPLCLLFVDVDDFKPINERFLHPGGDRALIAIAGVLASISKGKGKTYRYGGDEFVVLLPNFDMSEARVTAERARAQIENLKFEEPDFHVSVTIGGAVTTNARVLGAEILLKIADSALLEQKKRGKNQIAIESA